MSLQEELEQHQRELRGLQRAKYAAEDKMQELELEIDNIDEQIGDLNRSIIKIERYLKEQS